MALGKVKTPHNPHGFSPQANQNQHLTKESDFWGDKNKEGKKSRGMRTKKWCIPDSVYERIAGENLNSGEIRHVVLHKGVAVVQDDRYTGAVRAPFVVAVPEITQREKLDLFSLPRVP